MRRRQRQFRRQRAHLRLFVYTQRQQQPLRLARRDAAEHIALIVRRPAHIQPVRAAADIVAGGDIARAMRVGKALQRRHFHGRIAQHAGIRRLAAQIGRGKGRAHALLHRPAHILDGQLDPGARGGGAGRLLSSGRAVFQIQRQNPVFPLQKLRRHGGIHAPGQPQYHGLHSFFSTHIISAVISAGETPDIRPARPKFSGRMRPSFCRASVRSPGTAS